MIQAKYTEVLYNLLKNDYVKPLIDKAMSSYPMYVSTSKSEFIPNIIPTREELNKKILNYYKYREIGFETVGRFIDELEISLNEIMPYYNQLFFSADQDYNIIYNVDYKRTISRELDGTIKNTTTGETSTQTTASDTSTTNSETENYSKNVHSSTPQNSLSITNKGIDNVDYADDVNWNHDSGESSATNTGSSQTNGSSTNTTDSDGSNNERENTLETTKGNFGVVSAQDLIKKYREIILNIEQMIINDPRITELFMLVY